MNNHISLDNLISNNQLREIANELTKEDIHYLISALYSHKRSEIGYLLSIKEKLPEDKFMKREREIERRHQEVLEKLLVIKSL